MVEKYNSLSKSRKCLAKPRARALRGLQFQILGAQLSHLGQLWPSVSRPLSTSSMAHLRFPFVQHGLSSFQLTSLHCMTAFCWLCPNLPLQTSIGCCYFLRSLFGIRRSLYKTSWSQIFLFSYFMIPWYLGTWHWRTSEDLVNIYQRKLPKTHTFCRAFKHTLWFRQCLHLCHCDHFPAPPMCSFCTSHVQLSCGSCFSV